MTGSSNAAGGRSYLQFVISFTESVFDGNNMRSIRENIQQEKRKLLIVFAALKSPRRDSSCHHGLPWFNIDAFGNQTHEIFRLDKEVHKISIKS